MTPLDAITTWLATPLSGAADHAIAPWTAWHGRLMVLAWTILLPLGMLSARFFKVLPRQNWPTVVDSKVWWRTHLVLQSGGVLAMSAGLAFAFGRGGGANGLARTHHLLGWSVLAIGWTQVAAALLRGSKGGPTGRTLRGDHYDMTRRRIAFEIAHKALGWIALPIAVGATGLGLTLADAPRWMAAVIALWWIGFAALFTALQRRGWCRDTYQAIWGVDPAHPGNARRPIGLGIRRG